MLRIKRYKLSVLTFVTDYFHVTLKNVTFNMGLHYIQ